MNTNNDNDDEKFHTAEQEQRYQEREAEVRSFRNVANSLNNLVNDVERQREEEKIEQSKREAANITPEDKLNLMNYSLINFVYRLKSALSIRDLINVFDFQKYISYSKTHDNGESHEMHFRILHLV